MNRLKEKYLNEVVPSLMSKYNYKSIMEVPKLEKIVINVGVGDATGNSKLIDAAVADLAKISGQKPVITKAKKSIASFKLREGQAIGCKVTLRGENMYNFMDKLISISLPRVRDFRGVSSKAFDGRGNYTMGIKEQLIFSEIDYDDVVKVRGMDIVFVTTAKSNEESFDLLNGLGIPLESNRRNIMAKKSMIIKANRPQKYKVREYTRCTRCGRPHAVMSKFGICRICFRELAYKGQIPGIKKSSW